MATISGLTAERMREIEAASIVDGSIDISGHLILSRYDGGQIDAGSAMIAVPNEKLVKFLDTNGYSENTPPGSYPDGISLMRLDNVESTADWPSFAGRWGTVHTINHLPSGTDSDTNQTWTLLGGTTTVPEQWVRCGNTSGWGAWKKIALSVDVTAVDARVTTTNTNVTSLGTRMTSAENSVTSLGTRMTSAESRLTTAESSLSSQDTRVTALEGRLGPLYAIQCGHGTVNSGTLTALGYGASPLSPANGYTRAINRITIPSAGTYLVSYRYSYNTTVGTGRSFVELTLAATTSYQYSIAADTTTFGRDSIVAGENVGLVTATVALNAGAQIGINAFQSSTAVRSIDGVLNIQRIS